MKNQRDTFINNAIKFKPNNFIDEKNLLQIFF